MTFNPVIDDLVFSALLFCPTKLYKTWIGQNMPLVVSLFLECVHSWPLLIFVYLCLVCWTLNRHSREKWWVLTVLVMCVRLCAALPRQQVRSGICHAGVGSAPLTSLSSLDKDVRNLPLPLFLSTLTCSTSLPFFTSLCLTLASSISCLFLSSWILLYFYHPPPPLPSPVLTVLHTISVPVPENWLVQSAASGAVGLTQPACHTWFGRLG